MTAYWVPLMMLGFGVASGLLIALHLRAPVEPRTTVMSWGDVSDRVIELPPNTRITGSVAVEITDSEVAFRRAVERAIPDLQVQMLRAYRDERLGVRAGVRMVP